MHPIRSKSEAGDALLNFQEGIGNPRVLVVDGSKEQIGKKSSFYERARKSNTLLKLIEPYTPKQNRAEGMIGRLKRRWKMRMIKNNVPMRLWDYGFKFESEIMIRTSRHPGERTAYEKITGETPDISEWMDYDFYDWVYYWDSPGDTDNPNIGRWLGVSHRVVNTLTYYVLKSSGKAISRSTVKPITRIR